MSEVPYTPAVCPNAACGRYIIQCLGEGDFEGRGIVAGLYGESGHECGSCGGRGIQDSWHISSCHNRGRAAADWTAAPDLALAS